MPGCLKNELSCIFFVLVNLREVGVFQIPLTEQCDFKICFGLFLLLDFYDLVFLKIFYYLLFLKYKPSTVV